MNPYTMERSLDDNGAIIYTFTPRDRTETLTLSPDDFQSGAKMRAHVMAWIGTLGPSN